MTVATYLRPGISGAPISSIGISSGTFFAYDRTGSVAVAGAADSLSAAAVLSLQATAPILEAADSLSSHAGRLRSILHVLTGGSIRMAERSGGSARVNVLPGGGARIRLRT